MSSPQPLPSTVLSAFPADSATSIAPSLHQGLRQVPKEILRNRVHPAQCMTATQHRREIERLVLVQAAQLRAKDDSGRWARAINTATNKARAHQSCGQVVQVRACGGCGEARAGTAIAPADSVLRRCDMEVCGFCGRRKAQLLTHTLLAKLAKMPLSDGFNLVMITVTEHSKPTDSKEYTVERLEERVRALRNGTRSLWDTKRFLKAELPGRLRLGIPTTTEAGRAGFMVTTGMFERIELSDNGALHSHILFYGPRRDKSQVEHILKIAWSAAGFVDFKHIANTKDLRVFQASCLKPESSRTTEEQKIFAGIREVAKYSVKATSPLDEGHLAGERRWKVDPSLAAKYEIATYQQRLIEWRGILRGTPEEEAKLEAQAEQELERADQLHEKDTDLVCSCCGVVGEWSWREMPLERFVRACHVRREKALTGSRWQPP